MDAWRVKRALESFRVLGDVIDQLTEEEVYHCLQLEAETQRRKTIIDRLISKAADYGRRSLVQSLQEKFYASQERCSEQE